MPSALQENMRTLQGDAVFLQVSLSHQQEVKARLDSYITESQARVENSKQQAEVMPFLHCAMATCCSRQYKYESLHMKC